MRYSIVLLAAGLSQTLAQSWNEFGDFVHILAPRDLLDEDALQAVYARAADAEAYYDGDDDLAFEPMLARRVPLRNPMAYVSDAKSKFQQIQQGPGPSSTGPTYPDVGSKYDGLKTYHENKNMKSAGQSSYDAQKQKSGIQRRSPMKGSSSKQGNKVIQYMGYANDVNAAKEKNDKQSSSQTNTGTTYQDTGDKYKEVKKQEEQKNTQSAGQSSYNAQKKKSGIKRRSPMKGSSSKQGNKIIKWMGYADNVNSVKEKEDKKESSSTNSATEKKADYSKFDDLKKKEEEKKMPSAGQSSFNAQKQKSGIKRRSPMKGSSSNTGNKVLKYAGYANDVKSKQEDYSKQESSKTDTGDKYPETSKYDHLKEKTESAGQSSYNAQKKKHY